MQYTPKPVLHAMQQMRIAFTLPHYLDPFSYDLSMLMILVAGLPGALPTRWTPGQQL